MDSTEAVADLNVRELQKGDIIQFERKGFYIVDSAYDPSNPSKEVELIFIPDGKASTIALKYQVPEAPKKEKGKKAAAAGGTSSKDKDAAAKAKKAAATTPAAAVGLPEIAPTEAIETVLRSEGKKGFEIPVKVRNRLLLFVSRFVDVTDTPNRLRNCRPRCSRSTALTEQRDTKLKLKLKCSRLNRFTNSIKRFIHYVERGH